MEEVMQVRMARGGDLRWMGGRGKIPLCSIACKNCLVRPQLGTDFSMAKSYFSVWL